ncbi:MAG TPA: hypothetical protein VNH46_02115, partial [Gemmatimonadales bacterium]|nr:hypothetical protein [Gemmatimonadales bacterium]
VTLQVVAAETPPSGDTLPNGAVFVAGPGGGTALRVEPAADATQELLIGNAGGGTVSFALQATTSSGGPWLSVSPTSGSTASGVATVAVSTNAAGLAPGFYRGTITASFSAGAAQTMDVLLVVAPAAASLQRNQAAGADCAATGMEMVGTTIGNGVTLAVSFPRPVLALVVDNCGQGVDDATVVASIEGLSIVLTNVGGGQYSGTWTPQKESAAVAVALLATHPTLGTVGRNYTVSTSAAAGGVALPVLGANGVVEGAGFTPLRPLAPGSIVSLFGTGMAEGESYAPAIPLARSLNGTSVRIGDQDAPLYYVGPTQINAQVPFTAKVGESVSIVVNSKGKLTAPQSYLIAPAQPGIFNGAVLDFQNDPDHGGLAVSAEHPARIGHDLVIYSSGLGLVDAAVETGAASPGAHALLPVTVKIGGVEVPVAYAGLTPGYVGLYQVNVKLTEGVPTGDDIAVELTQNGITANPILPITLSIR